MKTLTLDQALSDSDFRNLSTINGLKFDLRYASCNNFTGKNLYHNFTHPFLHRIGWEKLKVANELLATLQPNLKFLVLDALRPRQVQQVLWNFVVGTPQEKYVANPQQGSMHNFGMAIDLTLADERGEVDMGTPFDSFTPEAEPQLEEKHLKEGKLTQKQIDNRNLLKKIMLQAGFFGIPHEWWHFDVLPKGEVRLNYALVE